MAENPALAILGPMGPSESEEPSSGETDVDGLEAAAVDAIAGDVITAIKSGDRSALADALRSLIEVR